MNFWHQSPFVRILLPFVLGIVFESQARLNPPWLAPAVAFGFLTFLLYNRFLAKQINYYQRYISGVIIYILLFLIGMFLAQINVQNNHSSHFSHHLETDETWVISIREEPVEKDRSVKIVADVILSKDSLSWHRVTGKILCYLEKNSASTNLKSGDRLMTSVKPADVEPPSNPGQFNYQRYLYHHSIYQQSYLPSESWTKLSSSGTAPVMSHFENLRSYLLKSLEKNGIEGEEYAVLSALVLGKKDYLSHDTHTAYASAGAMHVLAVSGLHVGLIYLVLLSLLGFLDKYKWSRKLKLIILLCGIWLYACVTGLSASVLRASVMFSFIAVAKTSDFQSNIYNTLAASALALLLYNPFMIIEVGFQLSYLAVLGIVVLQPKIYSWITVRNKWLDKMWQLTAVSIAAQLATFPLGLLYFHQFPNYFFLSNLIVIPAATLLLYLTLIFFVISWIPVFSQVVASLLDLLTHFLNFLIHKMEGLPHPVSLHISISILETWLIYSLLISGVVFLLKRKPKILAVHLSVWIVLFSIQIHENNTHQQQSGIVIHDASGKIAISLVEGSRCNFLFNDSLAHDREAMLFHVQNFWDSRDITDITYHAVDSLESKSTYAAAEHLFEWSGKRLLFINQEIGKMEFSGSLDVDYAIVADYWLDDLELISKHFKIRNLVFVSYHSKKYKEKILKQAQKKNIRIWEVAKNGALAEMEK